MALFLLLYLNVEYFLQRNSFQSKSKRVITCVDCDPVLSKLVSTLLGQPSRSYSSRTLNRVSPGRTPTLLRSRPVSEGTSVYTFKSLLSSSGNVVFLVLLFSDRTPQGVSCPEFSGRPRSGCLREPLIVPVAVGVTPSVPLPPVIVYGVFVDNHSRPLPLFPCPKSPSGTDLRFTRKTLFRSRHLLRTVCGRCPPSKRVLFRPKDLQVVVSVDILWR